MTTEKDSKYISTEHIRSDVLSVASAQDRYIILMNDTLQERNREYIIRLKELEDKLESVDDSLGRAEARVENVKGLLKNFHAMDSQLREISSNQESMLINTRSTVAEYKKKAARHLRYLQMIMITFIAFYYEFCGFMSTVQVAAILIVVVAFQESNLCALQLPACEEEEKTCNDLREKIKITVRSQDYIYEFIELQ